MVHLICRSIILTWTISWLVVFPLIHAHPEVSHAHERTNHTHGGIFHSVLSDDADDDFHHHHHTTPSPIRTSHDHLQLAHSSCHLLDQLEFGFSVLTRSYDPPQKHPIHISMMTEAKILSPLLFHGVSHAPSDGENISFWLLSPSQWSRPPPHFIS